MNKEALFCDGTTEYVIPIEPECNSTVTLRFRTAKDDSVRVRLMTKVGGYDMEKECSRGAFDYYKIDWRLNEEPFSYCFEIQEGDEVCYYNRCGIAGEIVPFYEFRIVPGFSTPDWAKGAVMYQIYIDRFCNGDPSNDVETNEYFYIGDYSSRVTDWEKYPASMGVREFYGGDIKGVIDKLDYLQELGVEVVYFNPLFVSPSNHKYDIQDYDYIDPHLGVLEEDGGELLQDGVGDNAEATKYQIRTTSYKNLEASNALFIRLVEELHKRGMKIILDGVFNHCGSFNKWMDRERIYENQPGYEAGAFISEKSPYREYFRFFKDAPENWPYNVNYEGWWGHDTLPKLNYEDSVKLENYILGIGKKWVSPPYNVDGWRLDVAADLGQSNEYNHRFWKKFRQVVKKANPNAIILAEHYGDPSEWLQGDEWDTVMNYDAFMEPITWFLTGMEKHSDEFQAEWYGNGDKFFRTMEHNMSKFQRQSLDVAMNELSNHDHSRFLTRTNSTVGRIATKGAKAANENVEKCILREAVVMQMTWPGAPTVYYGDEAGMVGWTDPDNRRSYPWGKQDWELIEFHKDMIRIHKKYECFRSGSYKSIASGSHWICYGRFNKKLQAVILINNRRETLTVDLPIWQIGILENACLKRVIQTTQSTYNIGEVMERAEDGILHVTVGPQTASVYIAAKNVEEN